MFKIFVFVALALLASCFVQPSFANFIGGVDADIKDVPYHVYIRHAYDMNDCSGTIISKFWILTTMKCAHGDISKYTINAGTSKREEGGSRHTIASAILLGKYVRDQIGIIPDDIALMRVNEPFEFDSTRQPIGLFNAGEETKPDTKALVSGWGDRYSSSRADLLQIAEVLIVTKEYCKEYYDMEGTLLKNHTCAKYPRGQKGPCDDHDGAPLVINGRLAGLGSWGSYCVLGYPVVYTEISAYRDWIKSQTGI